MQTETEIKLFPFLQNNRIGYIDRSGKVILNPQFEARGENKFPVSGAMFAPNPLEDSEWLFPVMECFHITGFALSIGTIAVVDFCVLGAGPRRRHAAELSRSLSLWTLLGLAVMLFSGPLLYLGNGGAVQYNRNPGFQFKILFLVIAMIYHYALHNRVVRSDAAAAGAALPRVVATVSLLLWCCVVFGGLFIAFTEAG